MRRAALVSGIIATTLISLGVVLKILHLPFGSFLVVLGFAIGMLAFLPLLLIYRLKNDATAFQKGTSIFGFIVGWLMLFPGLIFSIQRWPGGITLVLFGSALGLIFLFLFFLSRSKAGNPVSPREPFNIIIVALLVFLFAGRFYVRQWAADKAKYNMVQYNNALKEHMNMEVVMRQAYFKVISDTSDTISVRSAQKLYYETSVLLAYINKLRGELVGQTMGIDPKIGDTLSARFIDRPNDYDTPTNYMIGAGPALVTGKAKDLKAALYKYLEANYTRDKIKGTEPVDIYVQGFDKVVSWEWATFYHKTIIEAITTLEKIQTDILKLETQSLEQKEFISPN